MGGIGSGRRWHFGEKATTEDMRAIDVRRWAQDSLLEPGRTFGCQWSIGGDATGEIRACAEISGVRLMYRTRDYGGEWTDMDYLVRVTTTDCHLGGVRHWFLCPARECGRRVAILYGGSVFACRHCHRLAYPSTREPARDRAARRADKLRERLGWPGGILEGGGWGKPRGMHWRTYRRLCEKHDELTDRALAGYLDYTINLCSRLQKSP